ncbi:hypothetical protein [Mycobacteroides abscessus]|uniref:hypothetical protein n=1 Tax=Mycobacteroides abscessus TaxID=36809 RepID=UPI001F254CE2|nr:hypothetical protein [Mycobacteroides abscessus]
MAVNAFTRRASLAAVLTAAVGGTATSAVPGLEHWPAGSVALIVAGVGLLGGLLRKVLHAAVIAVTVTVIAVIGDAATGGHIQNALNLEELVHKGDRTEPQISEQP